MTTVRQSARALPPDIPPAVDRLLVRVTGTAGFPFADWLTDPASFAAMTGFWRELFDIAAGEQAAGYRSALLPDVGPWSHGLDMVTFDRTRRVRGIPCMSGCDFGIFWNDADDCAPEDLGLFGFPERTEFYFDCDMDRDRLIALAALIRAYIAARIASWEDSKALQAKLRRLRRRLVEAASQVPRLDEGARR